MDYKVSPVFKKTQAPYIHLGCSSQNHRHLKYQTKSVSTYLVETQNRLSSSFGTISRCGFRTAGPVWENKLSLAPAARPTMPWASPWELVVTEGEAPKGVNLEVEGVSTSQATQSRLHSHPQLLPLPQQPPPQLQLVCSLTRFIYNIWQSHRSPIHSSSKRFEIVPICLHSN